MALVDPGHVRVCVIGAGACGLTTIKQLKDQGIINIDCFEQDAGMGGIWNQDNNGARVYDNAYLTISNYMMSFSDMPPIGQDRYHWHHTEYQNYLLEYGKKFDLDKHIKFHTTVLSVDGEPGRWRVFAQTNGQDPVDMGYYNAVAVCCGAHATKKEPGIPGLETFTGKVIHSGDYKNNAGYAGKDIVIVGLGESSADIVKEISDVANSCTLALRSYPFLIPRIPRSAFAKGFQHVFMSNPDGCPSDAFTSVLHSDVLLTPHHQFGTARNFMNHMATTAAALMYSLKPSLGRPGSEVFNKDAFKQDNAERHMDHTAVSTPAALKMLEELRMKSGQCADTQKFACKNVSFVPNMVNGKIVLNGEGIKEIEYDHIIFNDGSKVRADCLVLCTGYKATFPFLKGSIGNTGIPLAVPENNVRNLWQHIFHPAIGKSMAWIGFARPQQGGIPATAEMSARYFALLVAGRKELPQNLAEITRAQGAREESTFSLSPDIKALVHYHCFMDEIAKHIGCDVKLWQYLLQPKMLVNLALGSMHPSRYRLTGPNAMPDNAKEALLSKPVAFTSRDVNAETKRLWQRWLSPKTWSPPNVMPHSRM